MLPLTVSTLREAAGWTPLHLFRAGPEPAVLWARLGPDVAWSQPFFDDTVALAQRRPWVRLSERCTRLADLLEAGERTAPAALSGLVLHVSRCGSTLVSQTLARLPGTVALSEPRLVTALLEDERLDPVTRSRALRAVVRLFARPGFEESVPRRVFLKCEPRSLFYAERLFAAFPDTPALLLHREPVEVLVANADPVPEALFPGSIPQPALGPAPRPLIDVNEYAAFVQARYFAQAAALADRAQIRTLDYAALPTQIGPMLSAHFRLPADEVAPALAAALPVNAKDSTRRTAFAPDSAQKRASATPDQLRWAAEWFAESRARLLGRGAT